MQIDKILRLRLARNATDRIGDITLNNKNIVNKIKAQL